MALGLEMTKTPGHEASPVWAFTHAGGTTSFVCDRKSFDLLLSSFCPLLWYRLDPLSMDKWQTERKLQEANDHGNGQDGRIDSAYLCPARRHAYAVRAQRSLTWTDCIKYTTHLVSTSLPVALQSYCSPHLVP